MENEFDSHIRTRKIKTYEANNHNVLSTIGLKYTSVFNLSDDCQFKLAISIVYIINFDKYRCNFYIQPNSKIKKNNSPIKLESTCCQFNNLNEFDFDVVLKNIDFHLQNFNARHLNKNNFLTSKSLNLMVYYYFNNILSAYDEKKLKKLISQYVGI